MKKKLDTEGVSLASPDPSMEKEVANNSVADPGKALNPKGR